MVTVTGMDIRTRILTDRRITLGMAMATDTVMVGVESRRVVRLAGDDGVVANVMAPRRTRMAKFPPRNMKILLRRVRRNRNGCDHYAPMQRSDYRYPLWNLHIVVPFLPLPIRKRVMAMKKEAL